MTISEKAKEKLDAAGKEIKTAVDNLKTEVAELSKKVKDKLEGTGDDMKETAEKLNGANLSTSEFYFARHRYSTCWIDSCSKGVIELMCPVKY